MAEFRALLRGTEVEVFDLLRVQQGWEEEERYPSDAPDERHFGALGDAHSTQKERGWHLAAHCLNIRRASSSL